MSTDVIQLIVAFVGLTLTIIVILYITGSLSKNLDEGNAETKSGLENDAPVRHRTGGLAQLRRRNRRVENDDTNNEILIDEQKEDRPSLTKKQIMKEMKKREKEEMRLYDEAQREERRKKVELKEERYRQKLAEREEAERMREETEIRIQEEKERKEQEEFMKWKEMFEVELEGYKAEDSESESQDRLQEFINYIKRHKVVMLEDLASNFNMTTQEAIDRVENLQESKRLLGIVDDRGKFISLTEKELDEVAKFIHKRGRIDIAELGRESNRLIQLRSKQNL